MEYGNCRGVDRNRDDQHSVCDAKEDPGRDYCRICRNVQLTSADNVQEIDKSSRISKFDPLNSELNPICYLRVLLGAHHFLHISRIRPLAC